MNTGSFGSDYVRRWTPQPDDRAFGVGLRMTPFQPNRLGIKLHRYTPKQAGNNYYLMDPLNHILERPFMFISRPENAYRPLDSMADTKRVKSPERRKELEGYLSHPSGVRRLTQITFTLRQVKPAHRALLESVPGIEVKDGARCMLTLTFDDGGSGRTLDLPTISPVRIRY